MKIIWNGRLGEARPHSRMPSRVLTAVPFLKIRGRLGRTAYHTLLHSKAYQNFYGIIRRYLLFNCINCWWYSFFRTVIYSFVSFVSSFVRIHPYISISSFVHMYLFYLFIIYRHLFHAKTNNILPSYVHMMHEDIFVNNNKTSFPCLYLLIPEN